MPRSAVAIALPPAELAAVSAQLAEAGYDAIAVNTAEELEALLDLRRDIGVAILDGENDFDRTIEMYSLLHDEDRNIPALMVVAARALDRMGLAGRARVSDEYFTRPYSAESLRWRVEAMLIRAEVPTDDSTGGVIAHRERTCDGDRATPAAARSSSCSTPRVASARRRSPSTSAAMLQLRKGQRVLLVDCDTVTGHVASSLGMENVRTVADAWTEDLTTGVAESFAEIASVASQRRRGAGDGGVAAPHGDPRAEARGRGDHCRSPGLRLGRR